MRYVSWPRKKCGSVLSFDCIRSQCARDADMAMSPGGVYLLNDLIDARRLQVGVEVSAIADPALGLRLLEDEYHPLGARCLLSTHGWMAEHPADWEPSLPADPCLGVCRGRR